MRQFLNSKTLAYVCLVFALLYAVWFFIFGGFLSGDVTKPDFEKIKNIQPFVSGIVVPLLTLGTSLLVIETFKNNTYQNISNNFFKMIDQNRKILEGVNCDTTDHTADDIKSKGKDFFDDLAAAIAKTYEALSDKDEKLIAEMDSELVAVSHNKKTKELAVAIYDHYYHLHQSDLGHYFRNLYYIVRYIDNSKIRKSEKIEFIKILRSQLSNYELLILAYNGLHSYGEKFYPFIEDYELLKSLNNETKIPKTYSKRIIDINVLLLSYPHLKNYWV